MLIALKARGTKTQMGHKTCIEKEARKELGQPTQQNTQFNPTKLQPKLTTSVPNLEPYVK